jgi:hypothetical protein
MENEYSVLVGKTIVGAETVGEEPATETSSATEGQS